MANSHVHDWSGFWPVVRIADMTLFPSYFLISSLALCICLVWLVARAEARGYTRNVALDLSLVVMISGFLGARFFHVFFEEPKYYVDAPARVLEVWRGGFVWYGGALAAIAFGIAYAHLKQLPIAKWLDLFAPVVALGYACGRIACWLTGCCYGDICYLQSGFSFRYPTQGFAILWEIGLLILLLRLEQTRRVAGEVFFIWLVLHSVGRIIMEVFRGDPRGPAIASLSIATWISLALIFVSGVCLWRGRNPSPAS